VRLTPIAFTFALFIATVCVPAQTVKPPASPITVAFTYSPQRSIVTGSGAGFWIEQSAADAAFPLLRNFSVAADIAGGHSGATTSSGVSLDLFTFVAGPRYTIPAMHHHQASRASIFLESLMGVAHGSNSLFPASGGAVTSGSSFALLTGGGVDLALRSHIGLRLIQADYARTALPNGAANVQNSLRIGAGLVIKFK
jgi:peptidoglycan-associated lipoprotein